MFLLRRERGPRWYVRDPRSVAFENATCELRDERMKLACSNRNAHAGRRVDIRITAIGMVTGMVTAAFFLGGAYHFGDIYARVRIRTLDEIDSDLTSSEIARPRESVPKRQSEVVSYRAILLGAEHKHSAQVVLYCRSSRAGFGFLSLHRESLAPFCAIPLKTTSGGEAPPPPPRQPAPAAQLRVWISRQGGSSHQLEPLLHLRHLLLTVQRASSLPTRRSCERAYPEVRQATCRCGPRRSSTRASAHTNASLWRVCDPHLLRTTSASARALHVYVCYSDALLAFDLGTPAQTTR
jgi:hypothetical protein